MLSSAAFYALLALLTVGLFWVGVSVARGLGRKAGYSLGPLGISRPKGGYLVGLGVGVAVGIGGVLASAIVNPISTFVLDRLGYSTESTVQQPFMRGLTSWVGESPQVAVPAILLVVVLVGPAVEELVFRGAVFNGLYRLGALISGRPSALASAPTGSTATAPPVAGVAFVLSALVSSAVFALLHLEPILLPALLILAVALCYLFAKTGSLLPPIVAHATFNSFAATIIILNGLGVIDVPV